MRRLARVLGASAWLAVQAQVPQAQRRPPATVIHVVDAASGRELDDLEVESPGHDWHQLGWRRNSPLVERAHDPYELADGVLRLRVRTERHAWRSRAGSASTRCSRRSTPSHDRDC